MDILLTNHIAALVTSFVAITCSIFALRLSLKANQKSDYLVNKVEFLKDRIDNQQIQIETVYMGMHEQMNRIEMMIGRLEGTKEK